MKRSTILMAGLVLLISASGSPAQNLLNLPESIVFDEARERYLVSNWGDGNIIQIDGEGNQTYFNTELSSVAGLHISGNILYAASNGGSHPGLIGFDLETGAIVMDLPLPDQDTINGVTSDNSGYVYVTDWGINGQRIYQVRISDHSYTVVVPYIAKPNGIEFDAENNRLVVLSNSGTTCRIRTISLDDYSVGYITSMSGLNGDGLTRDNDGYYYLSVWSTAAIYRYSPDFSADPEIIISGQTSPADIFFNKLDNILAIPNFNLNQVTLIPFPDTDDDGVIDINDNCLNTPNPDQQDTDSDGFGNGCDVCPGYDDALDDDEDGIPDGCDICPGFNDSTDADGDGVPDDCDNCPDDFNPGQEDGNGNDIGDICDYICADTDGDRAINILDIVYLINYLYKSGPSPEPMEAADINHDGFVNILDIVYLINFIYKNGPEPACF